MSPEEWERLCDGCAQCCLVKIEDADTGELFYTGVACKYLDTTTCRCTVYERRTDVAPQCLRLRPCDIHAFYWLPATCAYRMIAEGKELPRWHPLVSGRAHSVHEEGISVLGRAVSEEHVHPDSLYEHILYRDGDET